eukprot:8293288-Pyramimonas_sp.AAC.1
MSAMSEQARLSNFSNCIALLLLPLPPLPPRRQGDIYWSIEAASAGTNLRWQRGRGQKGIRD